MSILDAEGVTKRRTAAASALSARWLFNRDPQILAVCGSGHQASSHIQALINQSKQTLKEIRIWNHRKLGAEKISADISGWKGDIINIKVSEDVSTCVSQADLIVTATFSPRPYLMKDMIKKGAHIMSVGAVGPNLSEIHPDLMTSSEALDISSRTIIFPVFIVFCVSYLTHRGSLINVIE